MDLSDFLSMDPALASVEVERLAALGLVTSAQGRIGRGSYSFAGQLEPLPLDAEVVVRQRRVRKTRVQTYVKMLECGARVQGITVTDRAGDGRYWHLDGVHRLVAYRLLGLPCPASLWR